MPRSLKSKYCRSYAYKRNKEQRGLQKIYDMDSHNSHRNMNANANEITYVKFDCKLKFGDNSPFNYCGGRRDIPDNHGCLDYWIEDYDWKE